MYNRKLVLADGTVFRATAFGDTKSVVAEVVFNTGMTGYQEILSDPSYFGQMVVMTYPLIGNYGINDQDFESFAPAASALIVKEYNEAPSNWRSRKTLDEFLKSKEIPGLCNVDTRALTIKIREHGSVKAIIVEDTVSDADALKMLEATPDLKRHVEHVSTRFTYSSLGGKKRIVLVDFGVKNNIMRELSARGCEINVVPFNTTAEQIMDLNPDGVILSNGPGDPKDVVEALPMIREIQEKFPLFGICLGHQLFALANGADTTKMKFGHHGCNHPVKDLLTNKVHITSQNHGYEVNQDSISKTDLEVTHLALNDNTVEGLRHKKFNAFTVQYHPEAGPGPDDATYLFDRFMENIG
ncbi:MAG: glutamine-hydrolyzing carbamoyl-phosphate synthase small subunit [Turicibacter sp.]|nr:glutamine-hydrolyzing carbamoyl-phosphate synthase small subunit [Turicibacter sp.]